MTDAALVEQARDGDAEAFAILYDRYARLIRAIAYDATAEYAAAEDIVQEVFFKAFRRLQQLRQPDRFARWLIGITRHAARDWQRNKRRDRHHFGPTPDQSAETEADQTVIELRRAIRLLPKNERMALHLYYLNDQPAETARKAFGLSSSGFYKLLDRARKQTAVIMQRNRETMK